MPRQYTLNKRAKRQKETRQRIIQAAVELHESVGDAATTVTAIAERAGIGRLTVYRHFPDERALFKACTSHYFAEHPPPEINNWTTISDPIDRLEIALAEVYAYYNQTEGMLLRAEHDAHANPIVAEVLAPYNEIWIRMRDILMVGCDPDNALLTAAIGHSLSFSTWYSLVREQQLEDRLAVASMVALVRCLNDRNWSLEPESP